MQRIENLRQGFLLGLFAIQERAARLAVERDALSWVDIWAYQSHIFAEFARDLMADGTVVLEPVQIEGIDQTEQEPHEGANAAATPPHLASESSVATRPLWGFRFAVVRNHDAVEDERRALRHWLAIQSLRSAPRIPKDRAASTALNLPPDSDLSRMLLSEMDGYALAYARDLVDGTRQCWQELRATEQVFGELSAELAVNNQIPSEWTAALGLIKDSLKDTQERRPPSVEAFDLPEPTQDQIDAMRRPHGERWIAESRGATGCCR